MGKTKRKYEDYDDFYESNLDLDTTKEPRLKIKHKGRKKSTLKDYVYEQLSENDV